MTQDALGPDEALYAASANTNDARVFKSTDDGMVFDPSASFGQADWWQTLIVAPGNASNVFLSGYRNAPACDQKSPTPFTTCDPSSATDCKDTTHVDGTCADQKVLFLFRSVDGGSSFTALPGSGQFVTQTTSAGLTTTANSTVDLVGVSSDGSSLYARVTHQDANAVSDGLYKLDTAAGTAWTHMLSLGDSMSVLLRSNGDLVVGTPSLGAQVLPSGGSTFTALTSPPHINCLAEDPADHSVWACTQNDADGYGIMKTADLSTWSGVLHYQDIQAPVTCAAGTVQHDTCEQVQWCDLETQLGITSNAVDCAAANVDGPPDAGGGSVVNPSNAGCCDTGNDGAGMALLGGFAVGATLLVRRRRRPAR